MPSCAISVSAGAAREFCFSQQALVHGVGTELCVDNVGPHQLRLERQRDAVVGEAAQRVLGREQAAEAARWVFERGLDRVPAIEDGEPGCVAGARACRRPLATVPLCTNLQTIFGLPGFAGHAGLFPCVLRLCKPRVPPDLRMSTARWWGRQDSNLRRHSQRIYSPPPLPLGTLPQSRRTVLISKDKSGSPAGRSGCVRSYAGATPAKSMDGGNGAVAREAANKKESRRLERRLFPVQPRVELRVI